MPSNNLPEAGVIYALQMDRVCVQIVMGLSHTWGGLPKTGVYWSGSVRLLGRLLRGGEPEDCAVGKLEASPPHELFSIKTDAHVETF
jgi:hypothetical protein